MNDEVTLSVFSDSDKYFPMELQKFQFYDKYSRFNWDKGRRETWVETVDRVVDHLKWMSQEKLGDKEYEELREGLLKMEATPSMRMIAMAGKAARRHGQTIFNCSYVPVDSVDAWVEALIISMCGCGVGFSVESEHVNKLPVVKKQVGLNGSTPTHFVEDTMDGWAEALRLGIEAWFEGMDYKFDYSKLRPAGTPLKTKGGHSSGPKVLQETLDFIRQRMLARQGQKLTTLDAHDIMCKVGDASISGGVRRCMAEGTIVHTKKGMIKIEDVVEGDEVMTDIGYKKVTEAVDQGVQEVITITTETGMLFSCTPDHRIAVLSSGKGEYTFKHAEDIGEDDRLLFITHAIDGEQQELPRLEDYRKADNVRTEIKQPTGDADTYWMIGMLHANGYIYRAPGDESRVAVSFSNNINKKAANDKIISWFNSHGITPQATKTKGEDCFVVRTGVRRMAKWFGEFKESKTPIVIDDRILNAPVEMRAAYIAGVMDGDGAHNDRPITVVSTVYEGFARQIVRVLASMGIISEIKGRDRDNPEWQKLWRVSIKDHASLVRFTELTADHRCLEIPERKAKQSGYTIPQEFIINDLPRKMWATKYSTNADRGMNSSTYSELTGIDYFVPVQIESIEKSGDVHTYDLSVEGQHVFVAEGYLVHNTAMISLFDYDDELMLGCKDGDFYETDPQRFNANNSTVWPDREMTKEEVKTFMLKMDESKRGEPGIFSRRNANLLKPERRKAHSFGTNPCLSEDTMVLTKQGHFQIKDLVGKEVEIWDGDQWVAIDNFRVTSENEPMLKIELYDGSIIRATEYHKFVLSDGRKKEAHELREGDRLLRSEAPESHGDVVSKGAYLKGFLTGDGTAHADRPILYLYDTKYACEQRLIQSAEEIEDGARNTSAVLGVDFVEYGENRKRMRRITIKNEDLSKWATDYKNRLPVEIFSWDKQSKLEYIAGVMDADGTASDTKNGYLYQISSVHKNWLRDFQTLLKTIGVYSHFNIMKKAQKVDFNDGYGEYDAKDCWRLTISQSASIILASQINFSRLVSFADKQTIYKVSPRFNKIKKVTSDGVDEKVYCCTVETNHQFSLSNGITTGQCGEINLRPMQFCNLSIAVARPEDTFETLREKVRLATIFGTIQAMENNFPGLRQDWADNNAEERLLGVDITGFMDCPLLMEKGVLTELRDYAIEVNKEYAQKLDINQAAAVTCNKPSGNSSQLLNCSSGIHARWAPYYIRRVRVNANSPARWVMEASGVKLIPDRGKSYDDAEMFVADFVVESPKGTKTRNDLTAEDQFNIWLKNKTEWTEHNPSFTLTYKPEELEGLIDLVYENQEYIGGISFLPHSDAQYDLMPYEEIDEATYQKMLSGQPDIKWHLLPQFEETDQTEAAQLVACLGGACMLDF